MQNYDFYVWSTTDGDTNVYKSIPDLVDGETPFSADLNEDVVEIGVLIPTVDQLFINTHEHAFVKICILKDTHFNKCGEVQYVETDSSNLQSPREVVDYLKDDEYEILGAFYGIPLAVLNYASPYVDDEHFFEHAIEDIKKKDVESIVENTIKEFEGLGIHLKKEVKKDIVEMRIVKITLEDSNYDPHDSAGIVTVYCQTDKSDGEINVIFDELISKYENYAEENGGEEIFWAEIPRMVAEKIGKIVKFPEFKKEC